MNELQDVWVVDWTTYIVGINGVEPKQVFTLTKDAAAAERFISKLNEAGAIIGIDPQATARAMPVYE